MRNIMFSSYLKEKLNVNGYTFNMLIAKLQLSDDGQDTFKNLDIVTLSRWVNGRTEPSIKRQLNIVRFFEADLLDGIDYINVRKIPNRFTKTLSHIFQEIECSYLSLMYDSHSNNQKNVLNYCTTSPEELMKILEPFYSKMMFYIEALRCCRVEDIELFTIERNNKVIAHVSVVRDSSFIGVLFAQSDKLKYHVPTVNVGFFPDSLTYATLFGILACHLLSAHDCRSFYIITRGGAFLRLFDFFNAKVVSVRKNCEVGDLYLVELNIDDCLIHPYVINVIRNNKCDYREVIKNSPKSLLL